MAKINTINALFFQPINCNSIDKQKGLIVIKNCNIIIFSFRFVTPVLLRDYRLKLFNIFTVFRDFNDTAPI